MNALFLWGVLSFIPFLQVRIKIGNYVKIILQRRNAVTAVSFFQRSGIYKAYVEAQNSLGSRMGNEVDFYVGDIVSNIDICVCIYDNIICYYF